MNNNDIDVKENISKIGHKLSIHEFMVDILGGLFPGVLFILGLLMAIVPPLLSLSVFGQEANVWDLLINFINSTKDTPGSIWFVLFLLFALLGYVVGHIFYRRDIKEPDKYSFIILKKEIEKKLEKPIDAKKLNKLLKENIACTTVDNCEFPYPFYSDYLRKRKLDHLIKLACWCEEKDENREKRSKTYINILKIRLQYFFPDKCNVIIKNEGHVRLASSTWYVSHILRSFSVLGICIVLITLALNIHKANLFYVLSYIPVIMSPVTVLYMSIYFLKNISKFIHYQRLREIFYVLETTYTAFQTQEDNKLYPIVDKIITGK